MLYNLIETKNVKYTSFLESGITHFLSLSNFIIIKRKSLRRDICSKIKKKL